MREKDKLQVRTKIISRFPEWTKEQVDAHWLRLISDEVNPYGEQE